MDPITAICRAWTNELLNAHVELQRRARERLLQFAMLAVPEGDHLTWDQWVPRYADGEVPELVVRRMHMIRLDGSVDSLRTLADYCDLLCPEILRLAFGDDARVRLYRDGTYSLALVPEAEQEG